MNTAQMLAMYGAIVLTPCAALIAFSWLLNRHYDRQSERELSKSRHPSTRQGGNVRLLNLTVDDFLGCEDCFVGWHGIKNHDGRCLCCGFILPNSYECDPNSDNANYRRV